MSVVSFLKIFFRSPNNIISITFQLVKSFNNSDSSPQRKSHERERDTLGDLESLSDHLVTDLSCPEYNLVNFYMYKQNEDVTQEPKPVNSVRRKTLTRPTFSSFGSWLISRPQRTRHNLGVIR